MPNGQINSYSVRIVDLKNNSEITSTNTADGNQTNFIKHNLGMDYIKNHVNTFWFIIHFYIYRGWCSI